MPLAVAMPVQKQMTRFLTMLAMEFAAAASLPMCPIMTEYMVKPSPHISSSPRIGAVYFQKSRSSTLSGRIAQPSRIFTLSFFIMTSRAHASSMTLAITVAMAAPAMPIFGKKPIPKIKAAFRIILMTTETELMTALRTALPQFFRMHR